MVWLFILFFIKILKFFARIYNDTLQLNRSHQVEIPHLLNHVFSLIPTGHYKTFIINIIDELSIIVRTLLTKLVIAFDTFIDILTSLLTFHTFAIMNFSYLMLFQLALSYFQTLNKVGHCHKAFSLDAKAV